MQEWTREASSSAVWPGPPGPPVRVLLAGEQPVLLMGMALLFEGAPGRVTVVGTAHRLDDLPSHAALACADILFLDLGPHRVGSIGFLPALIADGSVKVIVFVDDDNAPQHEDAVRHGALGVVLKSLRPEAVLDAVERVHAGEAWIERTLVATMIRGHTPTNGAAAAAQPAADGDQSRRIGQLTQKERDVIAAVVLHRGAKGFIVAESLGISEHTLRNRLTFIYNKLHIRGKLNLYLYALEHALGPAPVEPGVRR